MVTSTLQESRIESAMPLLQLDHVCFTYKDHAISSNNANQTDVIDSSVQSNQCSHQHEALHNITLRIQLGEFVGIIGPSGAGKTTLASLISGAIPHHYSGDLQGSVRIMGEDTTALSLTDIACVVGAIMQDIDAQMVAASVEDELLFGLENFGIAHEDIPSRINQALLTVGISSLRHRDLDTLSGGQKQKVAIAALLALQPQVMVLDEPTCALDPVSSRAIFSILHDLNRDYGITIIVIEQKVALLTEFCQRLLVLARGELVLDAPVSEALEQQSLLENIGINYPRSTHLVKQLQEESIIASSALPVNISDTIATILADVCHTHIDTDVCKSRENCEPHLHAAEACGGSELQPCLRFNNVSFSYSNNVQALCDVSFDAYPGECIAVVGKNGAGKTTLTKLINGLLRPSEGMIEINGRNTACLRISQIARDVSTLFQNPDRQLAQSTVLDEVMFSALLVGKREWEARDQALEIIHYLQLDPDASPFLLSRGQRQMVALAATIVNKPRVLVLDEPTCGLDYRECNRIMQVVQQLRNEGCCVIMVCHDMEVVLDNASRIFVVTDGRLLMQGGVRNVFERVDICEQAALFPPMLCQVSQALVQQGISCCRELYTRDLLVRALGVHQAEHCCSHVACSMNNQQVRVVE